MPELSTENYDQLFMLFVEIVDSSKFEEIVPRHIAWLTRRFEEGSFVVTGGLFEEEGVKGNRALAILRAPSLQAAEEIISDDPFLLEGVCKFTFRHYVPRMHTEAFGSVFSGENSTSVARQ